VYPNISTNENTMKQLLMISIFAFAFFFAKAQDNFVINGHLSKAPNGAIITIFLPNSEGVKVEVNAAIKDGNFTMKGNIKNPEKIFMFFKKDSLSKGSGEMQDFFLDKGTTTITGTDKLSSAVFKGGKTQQEYLLLQSQLSDLNKKYAELLEQATKAKAEKNDSAFKKIQDEARPVYANQCSVKDAFVLSHPDSYVSLDLVFLISANIKMDRFGPLYRALTADVLKNPKGKQVVDRWQAAQKTASGKTFDFTQPDVNGKNFTLSSLKGKYVLVDFWASWCSPCRAENPNVLKAYLQFKAKNFEVVSISLDQNKEAWLNAVKVDKLPWLQVSDLKGFKNVVAVECDINSIPQNILVDPNGIIIAKNLRGPELETKLASILK